MMRLLQKSPEVFQIAILRIDTGVVGDVVAIVLERRGIKWQQPDGIDSQVFQKIKLFGQTQKITEAVAIAVVKGTDVDLVENGVFVPLRIVISHNRNPSGHILWLETRFPVWFRSQA